MKVIYMGTPDFAVRPLEALAEAGHTICLVVSQPDRAKDRRGNLLPTPVKRTAMELGIPLDLIVQPTRIREDTQFHDLLRSLQPDAIVVAAYGRILPPAILSIPRHGCINIHASLLPRHRGPSPIQSSIIAGDEYTGISIMLMDEGLDTGDIIDQGTVRIDGMNAVQLQETLSVLGAGLLLASLDALGKGSAQPVPQDDRAATMTKIIRKQDGCIDFAKSPETIERLVRGLFPWPSAYAFMNGTQIRFLAAEPLAEACALTPGTVAAVSRDGIDVSAGGRILRIKRLQAAGKKEMQADEFLRGSRIGPGAVFTGEKEGI